MGTELSYNETAKWRKAVDEALDARDQAILEKDQAVTEMHAMARFVTEIQAAMRSCIFTMDQMEAFKAMYSHLLRKYGSFPSTPQIREYWVQPDSPDYEPHAENNPFPEDATPAKAVADLRAKKNKRCP